MKQKALSYEQSYKDPSEDKNPTSRKKFCQVHRRGGHSTDECTSLKALIKLAKSNMSKGYKKRGEEIYTKYEVKGLIEKKLKKLSREKEV